ncbi:MAG TPA: hypothetical protein VFF52_12110, partial [Isosphaeraceae bacterium]|nr:hypothetical protein [Isosphaeraceae bacterium]
MAERRGRCWCAQIGLGVILSAVLSGSCAAGGLLDPAQFASLGTLPSRFVVSGDYVIDTNDCVLSIPTFQGVWSVQGVWSGGVAVFTFDSITIGAPVQVEGSHPVALLSHGDLNTPSILVTPGGNGPGGGTGGFGSPYGSYLTGGGGGFGGAGGAGGQTTDYVPVTHPSWPPAVPGGSGGASYGSPTGGPQVGSAGGVSFGVVGSGGAGGGGIELGAMGTIRLDGNLSADGANGT